MEQGPCLVSPQAIKCIPVALSGANRKRSKEIAQRISNLFAKMFKIQMRKQKGTYPVEHTEAATSQKSEFFVLLFPELGSDPHAAPEFSAPSLSQGRSAHPGRPGRRPSSWGSVYAVFQSKWEVPALKMNLFRPAFSGGFKLTETRLECQVGNAPRIGRVGSGSRTGFPHASVRNGLSGVAKESSKGNRSYVGGPGK